MSYEPGSTTLVDNQDEGKGEKAGGWESGPWCAEEVVLANTLRSTDHLSKHGGRNDCNLFISHRRQRPLDQLDKKFNYYILCQI